MTAGSPSERTLALPAFFMDVSGALCSAFTEQQCCLAPALGTATAHTQICGIRRTCIAPDGLADDDMHIS